ncbi:MAG: VPLPA-CTERM sorting domain-containing protein [Pseudomonadota bacterium]
MGSYWGNSKGLRRIAVAVTAACLAPVPSAFAATVNSTANVVFIVDESGSMGGAQDWLQNTVIGNLDAGLDTAGVTNRKYGVVGFGDGSSGGDLGRLVGGGLANASDTANNLGALETTGFFEDGYSAIDFALNNITYDAGAAINFILVTDEDRDNGDPSLTRSSIESALTSRNILLNAVVNNQFSSDGSTNALGVDSDGNAYVADGSGSYLTDTGGVVTPTFDTTDDDYSNLALATGGAAWNLNQLSSGGTNAISFADAFIDIKVQEIISQLPIDPDPDPDPSPSPTPAPIPVPAGFPLLLAGLGAFGFVRMRAKG